MSILTAERSPRHHQFARVCHLAAILTIFLTALAKAELAPELLAPADNSSPRSTLEGFISSCEVIYDIYRGESGDRPMPDRARVKRLVDELLLNLDLSKQPDFTRQTVGLEASACIKEILDRVDLPSAEDIPGSDQLEADTESGLLERWRIPGTALIIQRVTEGVRNGDYLFSPTSVTKAIKNYNLVKELPYKEGATRDFYAWYLTHPGERIAPLVGALPEKLRSRIVGKHALWQWIALGVTIILAMSAIILAYYFGRKISARHKETSAIGYALTLFYPILAMLVPTVFMIIVEDEIRIAGHLLSVLSFASNLIFLLASIVVISGLASRIAEFIISKPSIPAKGLDAQLIRIIARVLGLALSIIIFLEGGKYLGIPLSTLLASAGVGGVAFALAAQDSLKNFFGSIMIYMDKPYRIGERIVTKHYDGFVEEIGLRSTRLRLLNGHQATIPNEEMARSDIENISRRPHIRRLVDLRLPIDTEPDKVEEAVEIIREILRDHEGMDPERPPQAFYTDIHKDSLNLRFLYWYHPAEYWDFLDFSQRVNLQIMRAFGDSGITLAVPMRLLEVEAGADGVARNTPPTPDPETG
ncbi:MAG: mechanosensitive ion channel family protein [Verrucomicrobiales bacterium]